MPIGAYNPSVLKFTTTPATFTYTSITSFSYLSVFGYEYLHYLIVRPTLSYVYFFFSVQGKWLDASGVWYDSSQPGAFISQNVGGGDNYYIAIVNSGSMSVGW